MKLYVTPLGRWAGTQADAKAIGKEDGGWAEREVPTDKPGLIAFLNDEAVGCYFEPKPAPSFADDDISDLLGDDEPAVEEIPSAKGVTAALGVSDVIDWVLDATPPQIERTFAALGARFHEAVKDKAND